MKASLLNIRSISSLPFTNPRKTQASTSLSMAWTCKKCTFINSASRQSSCEICLSPTLLSFSPPSPPPSSSSAPEKSEWACKCCTFRNPSTKTNCEMCGSRGFSLSLSTIEDDVELDSSVGSVFLPLRTCKRKDREIPVEVAGNDNSEENGRFRGVKSANKASTASNENVSKIESRTFKVLSYNVWFREDLEMHKRMKALGDLIQMHSPDMICLQEVTPNIYTTFQKSSWWSGYYCSVTNDMAITRPYFCMQLSKFHVKSFSCKPFCNSIMGRELCVAELEVQPGLRLIISTTHLESPCPSPPTWDQMFSKERVEQAKEAMESLKQNPNVIFCGDMNWDDKLDGQFPLLDGWVDAWVKLRPGENGWTYDTKSNQMLTGNRTLQKRLDRFLCSLRDFDIMEIEMIGVEAIPGLSYIKEKKVKKEMQKFELPVLPSDHYGLLLTLGTK